MDLDFTSKHILVDSKLKTAYTLPSWFPFHKNNEHSDFSYIFGHDFPSSSNFVHKANFNPPALTKINTISRSTSFDEPLVHSDCLLQHGSNDVFQSYSLGPPKIQFQGETHSVYSGDSLIQPFVPEHLTKNLIQGERHVQTALENRRLLSFIHQWKRNIIFYQLWKNLESSVFRDKTKLKEYARQLQDIFPQTYKQKHSWRFSGNVNAEKLEMDISEMYSLLASKQQSTTILKQSASRMSRYFFEMLAESKECERRMYECQLFIEEKVYGRRDFTSKFNERQRKIDKQTQQCDTALADNTTTTNRVNDCHTTSPYIPNKNYQSQEDYSQSVCDSPVNECDENHGIRRTLYRNMEEQGELDQYSFMLKEISKYFRSRSHDFSYQFPTFLSQLAWLDETDETRLTLPPSQDSFRDGSLYTTCVYAEIKLMIALRAALTGFNKGADNKKMSSMLQNVLDLNNELYSLKRKLDSGRCALYKKLKLHWAERNSKWNCFPPLKRGYRLLNMLGKGGFAEVWEVFDPITLTVQAAKLHILSPDMELIERGNVVMRVKNEIDIHKTCRTHRHIVDMKACFEMGDNMLATILELCDNGDLDRYIKIHGPVPEELAIIWISQILEGLLYMKHLPQGRVHHCDLKPGNILFHKGIIKIADFGLSRMVAPDVNNAIWTGGGTIWYQPPECLLANFKNTPPIFLTDKIDMWAVGCILYEMLYCTRPFGATSLSCSPSEQIYNETLKGVQFTSSLHQISSDCKALIEKLLTFDPDSRLSIEEAMRLPIIKNLVKNTKTSD